MGVNVTIAPVKHFPEIQLQYERRRWIYNATVYINSISSLTFCRYLGTMGLFIIKLWMDSADNAPAQ